MKHVHSVSLIVAATLLAGGWGTRSAIAQETDLVGPVWELQQMLYNNDTMSVPDTPSSYTIQFFEDGIVGVLADCNVVRGTYDTESNDFITLGASTLAACPPDSLEDEYSRNLEDAVNYFFIDGDLYMDLPADAGTLQFSAADITDPADMAEDSEETEAMEADTMAPETPVEPEPVRGLW